jgi:hypothetical protein
LSYDTIRTCTILSVPDELFIAAARAAIEENPKNAPVRTLSPGGPPGGIGPAEMAVLTAKRWSPGRELRVAFMGGDQAVKQRIIPFAKRWEDHASIAFTFVPDGAAAEIRIAFGNSGSWSYLGTDALVIPANKPTMNYGWLTPQTDDDEYQRVVLHEFGHALSAIHEHAHPEGGIPWDLPKVYDYYQLTQGWSQNEVDQQVLRRYSAGETNFSAYDAASIMHYPVANALTIGDFEVGWNRDLSPTDRDFIATIYPAAAPQSQQLAPGQPVAANIGSHGEEDTFSFDIAAAGLATVSTSGPTDVVMSLFGPDSETKFVAFDDDSGAARNARIIAFLPPGHYWVRVSHFHPSGTGPYEVTLELGE